MTWWQLILTIAGVIGALGVIWKSPVGRGVRWLWQRNIGQPLSKAAAGVIRSTVEPLIEDVKAASRSQHDEQNATLGTIKSTLASHGQRLILIEDHITKPRR